MNQPGSKRGLFRRKGIGRLGFFLFFIERFLSRAAPIIALNPAGRRFFFDGDEKSSAATREFLAPLFKLARAKNCAIILVHHMTKGGESVKSIAGIVER